MKNQDTWVFAHHYCGKIWRVLGAILLVVTLIPMLLVIGKSEDEIGIIGLIVCIVQLAALISSIVPTERALKETFDQDGKRRNKEY
jgi:drug/metabolite transporter superfamily protein YnfA